jgi:hypothetical protein
MATQWRNSLAKALLREEIIAGTVTQASDPKAVHDSNPEYKKWSYSRFKPNLKNLIESVRNGNVSKEKWSKSQAKLMLREDIISGNVTDDMEAEDVYQSNEEYKKFSFANFKTNMANLKDVIYTNVERMEEDCALYGHDIALIELIRQHEPAPPQVPWHKSEARQLLVKDIERGKHSLMAPRELYQERIEYRAYSLVVFRNHIYQEAKKKEKQDH